MENASPMKPLLFYVGQVVSTLGIITYIFGISSASWVTLADGRDDLPADQKLKLVARYGPFSACTYGGQCDQPWIILAGVDKIYTQVIQMMMVMAAAMYLVGMIVMILQTGLRKVVQRCWQTLEKQVIAELMYPCAAVVAFVSTLMMGELKRTIIVHKHQEERIGYGFPLTLIAILLTVAGNVGMVLNRYADGDSRMARYIVKLGRIGRGLRKKRRTVPNVKDSQNPVKLTSVKVKLFVTEDLSHQQTARQGKGGLDSRNQGDGVRTPPDRHLRNAAKPAHETNANWALINPMLASHQIKPECPRHTRGGHVVNQENSQGQATSEQLASLDATTFWEDSTRTVHTRYDAFTSGDRATEKLPACDDDTTPVPDSPTPLLPRHVITSHSRMDPRKNHEVPLQGAVWPFGHRARVLRRERVLIQEKQSPYATVPIEQV